MGEEANGMETIWEWKDFGAFSLLEKMNEDRETNEEKKRKEWAIENPHSWMLWGFSIDNGSVSVD